MYCLLGIALYSIYSTESTFLEAPCVQTAHVIKLIRVKVGKRVSRERTGIFLLLTTHEIVCVTK